MATSYNQIHRFGTQAEYDALVNQEKINNNYLYFTSDTHKLYKGSIDYTDALATTATVGASGVAGKIYFETTTGQVKAYIGNSWEVISYPITTTINASSASDTSVPSEAAVVNYVETVVGNTGVVTDITQKVNAGTAIAGTLVGTKADMSTFDIRMVGLAVNPTWDPDTRQLVIPVTKADGSVENVTADIGKDIFLDPGEGKNYFDPDTKDIVLTLNNGTTASDPTVIRIPASALYNDYAGTSTNSGTVTIDGTNHSIGFNLNINSSTNNAISFDSNGLMVDLSAYATTSSVDTIRQGLQDQIDATTATIAATTASLDTLTSNYNATTAELAELKTNYNATTVTVAENTSNIAALATAATTWSAFADEE